MKFLLAKKNSGLTIHLNALDRVHCSLQNGTLMVATCFQTPHNLMNITILPPQHISNFRQSCGIRRLALNSMESIEFNVGEDRPVKLEFIGVMNRCTVHLNQRSFVHWLLICHARVATMNPIDAWVACFER